MYSLFKGYVPTKNKQCLISFKNKSSDQLPSLKDVNDENEYAGILNDNTILIDIDDYELSEIVMNIVEAKQLACRVYETTRGKHFLFKNNNLVEKNKTGCNLACGVKSDIKLGSRTSYSILKYNNKNRSIIYDIFEDEDYQTVPKYLTPIVTNKEFWQLTKGDGRNQEMFNYILTLQSEGFSKEEAKETIEVINKYVMKEPLSDSELKVVLRDDSFKKPIFFNKSVFLFDKFSKFLISEYNIVKINGALHCFEDGVYSPANIESMMIKHIPNLKQQQRKEVLAYLNVLIDKNTKVSSANYIAFKNGIYNLSEDKFEKFSSNKVMTNKINYDYNPEAYSELADKVLNDIACNDKQVRMLLEEVIGYTFYRRNELRKAFMLKGKRHNGKSTYLDLLAHLLGENNISSLDLADLGHEYKAAGLFGKLANIGDDVEDEYIPSAGIFKKIVSGDRINANVKYGLPLEFNPYCKLIFSGNTIPRLGRGRDSAAIIDRLVIIPFNAKFNADTEGFSPFIKYKLHTDESMEYLIKIGIEGLKRVLSTNKFTTNEQIVTELEEYEETLNPIITFFSEVGDDLENEPTKKCYRRYNEFCLECSMKPISHVEFSKQVKEQYGYDIKTLRVDGKPTKVFVKKEV